VRVAACAALCALLAIPTAAHAAPKPQTGRTVVVERTAGTVLVQPRGSKRVVRLGRARTLPVGSTIDATSGRVKLTSTHNRAGTKLQSAVFRDGAFTVTQNRSSSPLTDLELVGGDFADCRALQRRTGVFAAAKSARRRLWGSGKGRFRTRGRNGSATVRGTTWLTEDDCGGTTALNRHGKVDANSRDLSYQLEPGQSVAFSCNVDGIPGVVGLYCLAVLSQPATADVPYDIFAMGIAAETSDDSYQLCTVEPDGNQICDTLPFGALDNGFRAAGVGCLPTKAGTHSAIWSMRGQPLGSLPFDAVRVADQRLCVSDPPRPGIDRHEQPRAALRAAARAGQR
jgi:hypothetical protein